MGNKTSFLLPKFCVILVPKIIKIGQCLIKLIKLMQKMLGSRFWNSVHCISINVPPLTCYNLYIHCSIATIFGKNVAEKVGSQNVLYFLTSSNYCFCTTWGNRKPINCIFSLYCCMLFYQNTKQFKISPGQSWTTLHCQNNRLGARDRT